MSDDCTGPVPAGEKKGPDPPKKDVIALDRRRDDVRLSLVLHGRMEGTSPVRNLLTKIVENLSEQENEISGLTFCELDFIIRAFLDRSAERSEIDL